MLKYVWHHKVYILRTMEPNYNLIAVLETGVLETRVLMNGVVKLTLSAVNGALAVNDGGNLFYFWHNYKKQQNGQKMINAVKWRDDADYKQEKAVSIYEVKYVCNSNSLWFVTSRHHINCSLIKRMQGYIKVAITVLCFTCIF